MSDFLLIAPGDATEVSVDQVAMYTRFNPGNFVQLQTGQDLWELNDQLRAAELLPEGKEVVKVEFLAEFNRLWFTYGDFE